MAKSESVDSHYPNQDVDWDTPFLAVPSSKDGEITQAGNNPVVADLNAHSFAETARSTYDGDNSRSQSKFPSHSNNRGKQS